jgi:hypothetical protein
MFQVRNDAFESSITKKSYPFVKDQTGDDRRRAIRQLENEEAEVIKTAEAKAGRRLSYRELLSHSWIQDERSLRQKLAEGTTTVSQVKTDPDANPYRRRIAEIETEYKLTDDQRRRRILMLQVAADNFDAERQAKKERESQLNSSDFRSARLDADTSLLLVRVNPIFPAQWVKMAADRLETLNSTLDVAGYWEATTKWEAQRDAFLKETADRMTVEADSIRAAAKQVRNGEAPTAEQTTGA